MLSLTNARCAVESNRPVLRIDVNGKEAMLSPESVKPTLSSLGAIYLGEEFEDDLPPLKIHIGGEVQSLRGFVTDPRLVALWLRLLLAWEFGEFPEGPVPISA